MLDLVHRIYEADESFNSLDFMVRTRLFSSQIVIQIIFGTLVPARPPGHDPAHEAQPPLPARGLYATAGVLTLVGIFAMRWNVVIGGQLFSKSFLGYTTYKMGFATREGLLPAILLMILPFVHPGGARQAAAAVERGRGARTAKPLNRVEQERLGVLLLPREASEYAAL